MLAALLLGLAGVGVRSAQLQIQQHEALAKLAAQQYLNDVRIPAVRAAGLAGIRRAMDQTFSAEFLNRLDRVVSFRPLGRSVMRKILVLEPRRVATRAAAIRPACRVGEMPARCSASHT